MASTDVFAPRDNLIGMGWMMVATTCFVAMHSGIRHVGETVHPFEIAFFRNAFGFLALTPMFLRHGWAPMRAKRPGLLGLRAVLNIGAMLCYFTALTMAPLADVSGLGFLAPIFATLLAAVLLKERFGWRRAVAMGFGFAGALIILKPGFAEIETGHILVVISSLFWASAILIIKRIAREDSSLTIALYMGLMMAPLSLPFALLHWTWPSLTEWIWLAGIGAAGALAQWSFAESLKTGETAVVMPVDFMRLIWAAIVGYIAFGQEPGVSTLIGGAVIFGGSTYIAIRESRERRGAPPPPPSPSNASV